MSFFRERFRKTGDLPHNFDAKFRLEFADPKRSEGDMATARLRFNPLLFGKPTQKRCAEHTAWMVASLTPVQTAAAEFSPG